MNEVTLQQILQAREDRAVRQQQFLRKHHCPLIVFTMNIAGPVKTDPGIQRGFSEGLRMLEAALPKEAIRETYLHKSDTGWESYISAELPAYVLKDICVRLEESSPLGRLWDMDVLDIAGEKLERKSLRGCFVCGRPGRVCAAGRLHSVAQLQAATGQILQNYFAVKDQEWIARLAYESLLDEVNTTPKPGLVDRRNCGSHKDMTLATFYHSAAVLTPYFAQCVKIGQDTVHNTFEYCFSQLRQAGLEAEKAMYQATGGINTHKGAIFTMGLLCGSIGRLWRIDTPFAGIAPTLSQCAQLGQVAMEDFATITGGTAGEQLYLQQGLTGIRGEAAAGFPAITNIAFPAYTQALQRGLDANAAAVITLLRLIAQVEDTNLYHRGGISGAEYAKQAVSALLQETPWPTAEQVETLDDQFIAQNLSPGGCADLLAATCFLYQLTQKP